jgi:hypothetical protein
MKDRAEMLGEVAWDVLQRMVREQLARRPGGHLIEGDLRELELRLPLVLEGAGADPRVFAERLVRSIDRLLDDAVQHAAAFRPGHAWCHRCESAQCEHSRTPSCRHVFVGYAPTGMPRWEDFAQVCLERKHPEVDRLYEQPPAFLTLVQDKRELHGGILQAFRNGSYELIGQVTAGFFTVPSRAEEGRGVLALTIQAAASRPGRSAARVGLNLLGRTPAGGDLDLLWERQDELPWRRAVRWAQSALATLSRSRPGGRGRRGRTDGEELERRVDGILRGLARRLERDQRARSRRTRHAEQRHASGERPTRKAVDDAREARLEAVMVDERSGAVVVLGDRGRTHFFTSGGRLVSSVRYSKDAIARKIKHERWRGATIDEVETLREHLADGSSEFKDAET